MNRHQVRRCFLAAILFWGGPLAGLLTRARGDEGKVLWTGGFESNWMQQWHVARPKAWGLQNLKALADPSGKFVTVLRATFPKGSASPTVTRNTSSPVGGGQFFANLGLNPRDSLHLRFYVRFAGDFNFVKGGKLPGLFGGSVGSGGNIPDGTNGFSTRFMWRRNGDGEVYVYLPSSIQHGTSFGRGKWRFQANQWHLIEQEVKLNTPGKDDGRVRVWFEEKLVLDEEKIVFRTVSSLKIEGVFFCTFFGGNDPSWATPTYTYIDFANFAVGPGYIGP
jgi:hypothetical protein